MTRDYSFIFSDKAKDWYSHSEDREKERERYSKNRKKKSESNSGKDHLRMMNDQIRV